jgi:hypothetical protein
MDLGFEKDKYAGQIEEIDREKKEEKVAIEQEGRVFWTKQDWLEVKNWVEVFIQDHPETQFYTLSNKGLDIKNMSYCSKEDFSQKLLLQKEEDFLGKIHAISQNTEEHSFDRKKVEKVLKNVEESIDNTLLFVRKGLQSLEKQFSIKDFSVVEQECLEPVYWLFLTVLWEVWRHFFLRIVEEEKSEIPKEFRIKLHQLIFFENVLRTQKNILEERLNRKKLK